MCYHSTNADSDVGMAKNSHFIAGDDTSKEHQGKRRVKSAEFWDALGCLSPHS
jgi:hypothetical protein